MTPAETLRRFRKARGWSQTEMGEQLVRLAPDATPVHWTTVSRWERDVEPVPPWLPLALRGIECEERHAGAS